MNRQSALKGNASGTGTSCGQSHLLPSAISVPPSASYLVVPYSIPAGCLIRLSFQVVNTELPNEMKIKIHSGGFWSSRCHCLHWARAFVASSSFNYSTNLTQFFSPTRPTEKPLESSSLKAESEVAAAPVTNILRSWFPLVLHVWNPKVVTLDKNILFFSFQEDKWSLRRTNNLSCLMLSLSTWALKLGRSDPAAVLCSVRGCQCSPSHPPPSPACSQALISAASDNMWSCFPPQTQILFSSSSSILTWSSQLEVLQTSLLPPYPKSPPRFWQF